MPAELNTIGSLTAASCLCLPALPVRPLVLAPQVQAGGRRRLGLLRQASERPGIAPSQGLPGTRIAIVPAEVVELPLAYPLALLRSHIATVSCSRRSIPGPPVPVLWGFQRVVSGPHELDSSAARPGFQLSTHPDPQVGFLSLGRCSPSPRLYA